MMTLLQTLQVTVVALTLTSSADAFQAQSAAFVRQMTTPLSTLSLQPTTTTSSRNSRTSLFVSLPMTKEEETAAAALESPESPKDKDDTLPVKGDDGIYHITNQDEYKALLSQNPDQIIVLKVYAPWCRACKGLEPKFAGIVHDRRYEELPVIFADLSIQHNKAFVQQIGVLALPTIQLYIGQAVQDNFPCGPSKVPILKRKLTQLIDDNLDTSTNKLREEVVRQAATSAIDAATGQESSEVLAESTPTSVGPPATTGNDGATPIDAPRTLTVPQADKILWKTEIPYFNELSLADYDVLLDKAKILQFESGSILMREGRPGRTFYILQSGEVEICQRSMMGDPMTTPASYLGTVINRFQAGDFFGERALITGEPRAASIRATENITCWAFDKDDFPPSSVLSGRTRIQDDVKELEKVNDKYGVAIADLYQQNVAQQIRESVTANQVRGSFNRPEVIYGVDTEEEAAAAAADDAAVSRPTTPAGAGGAPGKSTTGLGVEDDAIFSLLNRFKMVQLVTRCFRYIIRTRAQWGDEGIRTRRNMLVSRLTPAQRAEYRDAFRLIDKSGDGMISLLELKRVMNSIGETKSDDELKEMISKARDSIDDESVLNLTDFMGIMAETEFYHLFRDIFASMDPNDTGFVKKADLERVLCGVRDLISDDRKSIIDVEDDDMLIDYEQFTRMLLGSALI